MPTALAFRVGTRRVILSFSNSMMNSSSLHAGDFLFLDAGNLADAMGGIDDMIVGLEFVLLVGIGGDLLGGGGGSGGRQRAWRGRFERRSFLFLCGRKVSGDATGGAPDGRRSVTVSERRKSLSQDCAKMEGKTAPSH